jgi:anti-sigma regulatory factor (Ser/Thr protein kinase)
MRNVCRSQGRGPPNGGPRLDIPGVRQVREAMWSHRPPPEPVASPSGTSEPPIWYGEPATTAELCAQRGQLRTAVLDRAEPANSDMDDVDRLLLVFEELGSNGLRHGHPPVQMTVTATGTGWILDVTDAAPDRPPAPAIDRDPAEGGMGLYIVARLCAQHGWDVQDGKKHVWGRVDFAPAPTRPHPTDVLPQPRGTQVERSPCR